MDTIPDNIEELYVDNNTNNIETFGKYVQDGSFLFSDITEHIIGPVNSNIKVPIVNSDSNYTNIEMSISIIDDEYLGVDIIEKIKEKVINNFMDDPENYKKRDNIYNKFNKDINDDKVSPIPDDFFKDIDVSQINYDYCQNNEKYQISESYTTWTNIQCTDNPNDAILDIDNLQPNNFFDCFNEETSVNNVIACDTIHDRKNINEMTTSYMFESEDMRKNDIYPFANGNYNYIKINKPKGWLESLGIITTSAMMLFGNID